MAFWTHVLVGIDPKRHLNNGEPAFLGFLIDSLELKLGAYMVHLRDEIHNPGVGLISGGLHCRRCQTDGYGYIGHHPFTWFPTVGRSAMAPPACSELLVFLKEKRYNFAGNRTVPRQFTNACSRFAALEPFCHANTGYRYNR
jgi:hypothetical protein